MRLCLSNILLYQSIFEMSTALCGSKENICSQAPGAGDVRHYLDHKLFFAI